jgi:DNA-binding Lrp family transcriptional regulator
MKVSAPERRLLEAIEDGLPIVSRPYRELGLRLGLSETEVIDGLTSLIERGIVKRLGLVVRHRELGYAANAMVVWDVADDAVADVGRRMSAFPFVTLCYRRPRRPPRWPYNLFCMIHGKDRETVLAQIERLRREAELTAIPHEVLFSRTRFKQQGARYSAAPAREVA